MKAKALATFWVIYNRPSDFPDNIVVRRQSVFPDGTRVYGKAHLFDTIKQARDFIPEGSDCIPRSKQDDPVIVESWVS
jgi:hypothetical protein